MNAINSIKTIIDEWDPIDLMTHAPNNEYHSEIAEIEILLKRTDNICELATGIHNVFINSFNSDIFKKTYFECIQIAKKLIAFR